MQFDIPHKNFNHNRIRKHRKIMGYKQKDLAFLLGSKDTTGISRWENGTAIPSIIILFKLSIILRTLPTELYFELVQKLREDIVIRENAYTKK